MNLAEERTRYLKQANAELKLLCSRWFAGKITQQNYRQNRAEIIKFLIAHNMQHVINTDDLAHLEQESLLLEQGVQEQKALDQLKQHPLKQKQFTEATFILEQTAAPIKEINTAPQPLYQRNYCRRLYQWIKNLIRRLLY